MNTTLNEIGVETLAQVGHDNTVVLLYAQAEDGVISANIFFQPHNKTSVIFRFGSQALQELVYDYWASGDNMVVAKSWFSMELVIRGSKFETNFCYPNGINQNESRLDRRAHAVTRVFPDLKIDYSNPKGT